MAESKESIIIEVDIDAKNVAQELSRVTYQIATLKELQKSLKKEIDAGNDATGEMASMYAQVDKELKLLTSSQKALTGQLQIATEAEHQAGDSFREMDAQLRNLENQYKSLTKAQRESAEGQQLKEQIISLKQELKDFDAELGNHQRNVGNYPKLFQQATPAMSRATSALASFNEMAETTPEALKETTKGIGEATKASIKFIATPLGAALTAIVAAIKLLQAGWSKLTEAIKKNDDAGTNVARLYAVTIQPVIDKVTKAFGKLADWVGRVAGKLADFLGGTTEAGKAAENLTVAVDNLEEAERQYVENSAKNNAEIAKLRDKSVDKEKYTVEQRKAFLQEANRLERENLEADKAIKAEQLRILEETAKREVDTSDETKDKIAQARAALYASEQEYYSKTKELNSQLIALDKEREDAEREAAASRLEIERKIEDSVLELEKDATQKSIVQIQRASEREIEDLRLKLDKLKKEDVKGREALQRLIEAKEKETQQKIDEIVIKATEERESKAREIARQQAEMGVYDAQELARMRFENAKEDYERLKELTREQVSALYNTEAEYQLDVLNAQRQFLEAKDALELGQYENEKQARQNEFEERKNAAYNNEAELAQIELEQAAFENEQLVSMDEATKARLFKTQEEYEAAVIESNGRVTQAQKKAIDSQRQMATSNASAIGGMMGSLSNLLDQYGEENKEAAIASKAIALGKVAVDTGIAISSGVAQAQSVPFPANIAAIATTVGTVLGNMATAITTIKNAKFEHGGVIGGESYTGDHVLIRANSGEGVYTGKQANTLLQEIANNPLRGGVDYEPMAAAMAAAVASMPAPVVDITEMHDFEDKVTTYNELAAV